MSPVNDWETLTMMLQQFDCLNKTWTRTKQTNKQKALGYPRMLRVGDSFPGMRMLTGYPKTGVDPKLCTCKQHWIAGYFYIFIDRQAVRQTDRDDTTKNKKREG